jgi:hypothetical protein
MLSPFYGNYLPPGMGQEVNTAEFDVSSLIYGGDLRNARFVHGAVVDSTSSDPGNTGNTGVLRPGLIMAQVTSTGKWKPFVAGATDGTQFPKGVLFTAGLAMGSPTNDRFLASILVGGVALYSSALVIAADTSYGLAQTGAGATVRKYFAFAFQFADDWMNLIGVPISART